ncbi:ATP-binding protein [Nocardia sp. NPDC052112]|uniref:sensor histidine kinase n=1 Tax=Nocardia sp. NPDC052112 TaxID=3155646 RepID=UPI0034186A81
MVTAAIVAVAVCYAPNDFRIPLAIGAGVNAVVLSTAVAAAVYYRRASLDARHAAIAVRAAAGAQLTSVTAESHAQLRAAQDAATTHAADARTSENRRAAATSAFAAAAGRMQAMSTSMLAELREMEDRHADPTVLADLFTLDHRTGQLSRLADSIAVLSGGRTGRRWAKPIAMQSILRGAQGRVAGYQRVRQRAVANVAVVGYAAEGIMHALAELIDNACNFSPPTTEVHLYAAEVPAGVVITIEDSGLVMSQSALARAEVAVSGTAGDIRGAGAPDLSSLSGTRLGLAVVGLLARKHGLTVSYRPSAIGGTAVVVVVPRELITRVDQTAHTPLTTPTSRPIAAPGPSEPLTVGGSELPKRRRGSTLAAVHPDGVTTPKQDAPVTPKVNPAQLSAFQRVFTGRDQAVPPAPSVAVENE